MSSLSSTGSTDWDIDFWGRIHHVPPRASRFSSSFVFCLLFFSLYFQDTSSWYFSYLEFNLKAPSPQATGISSVSSCFGLRKISCFLHFLISVVSTSSSHHPHRQAHPIKRPEFPEEEIEHKIREEGMEGGIEEGKREGEEEGQESEREGGRKMSRRARPPDPSAKYLPCLSVCLE